MNQRPFRQAPDEYYHIYNRGVGKKEIFLDQRDYARFLFLILFFQSPKVTFSNLSRPVTSFVRHQMFNIKSEISVKVEKTREIELAAFALMPNHFHLLLKELSGNGISKFMQRVGNAYAKYFNTKYGQTGHLFESSYHSVHIADNDQFLYLTAYIHKNCTEIKKWAKKESEYPWSSYQDFLTSNRWPKLLSPVDILEQFSSPAEYQKWVGGSGAKMKIHEESRYLLDI